MVVWCVYEYRLPRILYRFSKLHLTQYICAMYIYFSDKGVTLLVSIAETQLEGREFRRARILIRVCVETLSDSKVVVSLSPGLHARVPSQDRPVRGRSLDLWSDTQPVVTFGCTSPVSSMYVMFVFIPKGQSTWSWSLLSCNKNTINMNKALNMTNAKTDLLRSSIKSAAMRACKM